MIDVAKSLVVINSSNWGEAKGIQMLPKLTSLNHIRVGGDDEDIKKKKNERKCIKVMGQ